MGSCPNMSHKYAYVNKYLLITLARPKLNNNYYRESTIISKVELCKTLYVEFMEYEIYKYKTLL